MSENYRVQHIKKVHQIRRQATQEKIDTAIKTLLKEGRPVNFNSVSKKANVSITTLYNNKAIKEQISSLRSQKTTNKRIKDISVTDESYKSVIESLKNKIKRMEKENRELKEFIKNNFEREYRDL